MRLICTRNIVRMNSLMTESFFSMMLPQKSDQRVRQCPVLHRTSSACVGLLFPCASACVGLLLPCASACVGATFACYSLVPLLVFACYIIALHLCLPFVTQREEGVCVFDVRGVQVAPEVQVARRKFYRDFDL